MTRNSTILFILRFPHWTNSTNTNNNDNDNNEIQNGTFFLNYWNKFTFVWNALRFIAKWFPFLFFIKRIVHLIINFVVHRRQSWRLIMCVVCIFFFFSRLFYRTLTHSLFLSIYSSHFLSFSFYLLLDGILNSSIQNDTDPTNLTADFVCAFWNWLLWRWNKLFALNECVQSTPDRPQCVPRNFEIPAHYFRRSEKVKWIDNIWLGIQNLLRFHLNISVFHIVLANIMGKFLFWIFIVLLILFFNLPYNCLLLNIVYICK